jgi:hypothetical protein
MDIVTYTTSLDLRYYAQTIGCAVGDLGYKTAQDLYYGKKCATDNLRKLKLAIAYLNIIENYNSIAEDPTDDLGNCITEEQLQGIIIPTVTKILNTPLPPPGKIVTEEPIPVDLGTFRITEIDVIRETEDGNLRVIE